MHKTFQNFCILIAIVSGILLPSAFSLAQEVNPPDDNSIKKFTVSQLQEDFTIFRKILEEDHPGLYRYTDKKELDACFDNAFKQLNREMTEREFFPIIASICSRIKCGHTRCIPSGDFMSHLKVFPCNLRFINGKPFIVSSPDNLIIPGCELLSINGKKMSEITNILLSHLPADGDILTGKYQLLNRAFEFYYNFFIEEPDFYNFEYRDATNRKKNITVAPIIENQAKMFAKLYNDKSPVQLEFLPDSNTSLLTINTFGDNAIPDSGQGFRTRLRTAFHEIKEKNIQNLIIDLRNNGGGEDELGSLLFSYLTDKEFKYFDYIETSTNNITLSQYINGDPKRDKMFIEDLMPGVAGRFRLKEYVNYNLQQWQQPQDNNFAGKVWFLISGFSFSTTADFCSIAHFKKRGSFIGEETGGAYYGNNSGEFSMFLTLPNTKTRVFIPTWKYVNAVSGYANTRRGIIPDYPVQPTIQDVLSGIDTELMFTLKLIKNGR